MFTFARFTASFMVVLFPLAAATASPSPPTLSEVSAKLTTMQVPFVPNGGQWDKQAAFAAHTFAGTLFVTTEGKLVYSLPGKAKADQPKANGSGNEGKHIRKQTTPGWVLTETFIGANHKPLAAKPAGYRPAQAKASYMIGANNPQGSRHAKPLDTFERVRLGEVFKGVEVELRATGSNVEKIFTVKPHQDPKRIRLHVAGANKLALGKTGELIVQTGNGPVTFTAPIAYQEDASRKRSEVKVAYALNTATQSYGFTVGDYNPDQALVIDPLLQSTYLGGTGTDTALALAIHPASGEVYVAGVAGSTTFPATINGAQPAYAGSGDAFVSSFNASLTVLMQSTYLGGGGLDVAYALAIHPTSGDVYVAGSTESTNFPIISGGVQTANAGRAPGAPSTYSTNDAFVSRFNASLTTLIQSTYLGGTGVYGDYARALTIHPMSGEVYVAGDTDSIGNFPGITSGAHAGLRDAFVSRFNANLTALTQSTYLGGAGKDVANTLAIHPMSGDVYVAGDTESTTFPGITSGAYAGLGDAFISRFNASLTMLMQSAYLGGAGGDVAYALAIHPASGEVYVAGYTASTTFPGTAGGAQPVHAGGSFPEDAFVSRFNASLTMLTQSTYLGGAGGDVAYALAIHPASGEVYLAGQTGSATFPGTAGGAQATCGFFSRCIDAFISRFNTNLTTLAQSTYLGGFNGFGSKGDVAYALAIHPTSGEVYVAGATSSTDFPATLGGAQPAHAGSTTFEKGEAFVTRISRSLALVDVVVPGAPVIRTASAGNAQATVSFTAPASNGGSAITGYTVTSSPGGITATGAASPLTVTGLTNGTAYTFTVTTSNAVGQSVASGDSNSVTLTVPPPVPAPAPAPSSGGGGCFIATAAYGSYLEPEVMVLRGFRDRYLLTNDIGKTFVTYYYKWSPPVADFIKKHESLRLIVRIGLTPLVYGFKYPVGAGTLLVLLVLPFAFRTTGCGFRGTDAAH